MNVTQVDASTFSKFQNIAVGERNVYLHTSFNKKFDKKIEVENFREKSDGWKLLLRKLAQNRIICHLWCATSFLSNFLLTFVLSNFCCWNSCVVAKFYEHFADVPNGKMLHHFTVFLQLAKNFHILQFQLTCMQLLVKLLILSGGN